MFFVVSVRYLLTCVLFGVKKSILLALFDFPWTMIPIEGFTSEGEQHM